MGNYKNEKELISKLSSINDKLIDVCNDINSYIWKGPRVNGVQAEYKLVDADYDTLKTWYVSLFKK